MIRRTTMLCVLWILLLTSAAGAATSLQATDALGALMQAHADQLARLSSVDDARAFFSSHLVPELKLPLSAEEMRKGPRHPPTTNPSVGDWSDLDLHLTRELAAWRLSASIEQAVTGPDAIPLHPLLEQSRHQMPWLMTAEPRPSLDRALRLARVLDLFATGADAEVDDDLYREYAHHLDQRIPRFTGPDAWLSVAEGEGPDGVQRQLMSVWDGQSGVAPPMNELPRMAQPIQTAVASRYFHTRLRPVFLAYAAAAATRARAEAERRAHAALDELKRFADTLQERRAQARLCGTWQWTIHNHQNHADHKAVMIFPPTHADGNVLRPAKTVLYGDVLYLRWEFQGGVQEDSLLFTANGQRLEGTFTNSSGAWGSITGKRTGRCPQ